MAITPIPGSPSLPHLQSPSDASARSQGKEKAAQADPRIPSVQTKQQKKLDLKELRAVSAQSGLEVRFSTLEGSNVTLIRIVDPATGKVVREFPPEGLAKALAAMRAKATVRLNRRGIDRRA